MDYSDQQIFVHKSSYTKPYIRILRNFFITILRINDILTHAILTGMVLNNPNTKYCFNPKGILNILVHPYYNLVTIHICKLVHSNWHGYIMKNPKTYSVFRIIFARYWCWRCSNKCIPIKTNFMLVKIYNC